MTWNKRALATSPVKPFFWKRYVDDVISAVSGNESERLLSHLNSIEPSTQFTLEREKDNMAASPINEVFWTTVHCFLFILEYWETWFDVNCIIELYMNYIENYLKGKLLRVVGRFELSRWSSYQESTIFVFFYISVRRLKKHIIKTKSIQRRNVKNVEHFEITWREVFS